MPRPPFNSTMAPIMQLNTPEAKNSMLGAVLHAVSSLELQTAPSLVNPGVRVACGVSRISRDQWCAMGFVGSARLISGGGGGDSLIGFARWTLWIDLVSHATSLARGCRISAVITELDDLVVSPGQRYIPEVCPYPGGVRGRRDPCSGSFVRPIRRHAATWNGRTGSKPTPGSARFRRLSPIRICVRSHRILVFWPPV